MRLARDVGSVSDVLPEGQALGDCPYRTFDALLHGLAFLSFEELPKEDRPPKRLWLDGEKLDEWFQDVRARQRRDAEAQARGQDIEDPVDQRGARSRLVAD